MNLTFHLLLHVIISALIAAAIYTRYRKLIPIIAGVLLGGVFVDLDHLIDYFLAFGTSFNLNYFLKGYEFLKSDKIYVLFHAWEWVALLLIISMFFKKRVVWKILIIAVALGLAGHLYIDTFTNQVRPQGYFITYRTLNRFYIRPLVTPEHWIEHQQRRK